MSHVSGSVNHKTALDLIEPLQVPSFKWNGYQWYKTQLPASRWSLYLRSLLLLATINHVCVCTCLCWQLMFVHLAALSHHLQLRLSCADRPLTRILDYGLCGLRKIWWDIYLLFVTCSAVLWLSNHWCQGASGKRFDIHHGCLRLLWGWWPCQWSSVPQQQYKLYKRGTSIFFLFFSGCLDVWSGLPTWSMNRSLPPSAITDQDNKHNLSCLFTHEHL